MVPPRTPSLTVHAFLAVMAQPGKARLRQAIRSATQGPVTASPPPEARDSHASGAARSGRRGGAARRPRPAPTCRPRSSGTTAGRAATARRIASTSAHCSSTSSARVKSVASPSMQSRISRSYASGQARAERAAVEEVHVHGRIVMPWPGTFALIVSETPSSGWMWRSRTFGRSVVGVHRAERGVRSALELDRDRRLAPRQTLAGPDVERRVGPAPVVDEELRGDERLGRRVGRDPGLLAGSRAPRSPSTKPGPYWPADDVLRAGRVDGAQHLDLLVADGVGREVDRRLHRRQRDELQQVVLDDVADRARLLVEAGAALDADRLAPP